MKDKNESGEACVRPPQCFLDAFLRIRPGAFKTNASLLLKLAKKSAASGLKSFYIPAKSIAGGDCGSLADHPTFAAALAKSESAFRKSYAKIKKAPKLVLVQDPRETAVSCKPAKRRIPKMENLSCSLLETLIADAGPDPCLPFCGRPGEVFSRQVVGLARRLAAIGCKDAVIGLSGGLDSALALLVTVGAFRLLDLDEKGIHVYTMPGFGTTKRTRGNADLLAEGLGLKLETIDITPACRQHFKDIRQSASRHDVTFENAQARERTQILMDKANQFGGIVVGTGDMSEIALGWCTYNGDHMSMFGANSGVPKTVVREVCRWWAEKNPGMSADALLDIIATPVSPELLPSKNGKIAQKTEDKVGPYELHDFFMWHFIANGESPKQILAAAKQAFRGSYDAATVAKWLDVFFRRLHSQSFKRNCAPDGVRVYGVYFGPDAWHVPSDISAEWMSC